MENKIHHNALTRVFCEECGWHGRIVNSKHGYAPVEGGDVEPKDYCPECESTFLQKVGIEEG